MYFCKVMSKNKGIKLKDIPHDVLWVWMINGAKQPIGKQAYDKATKIIDDYPEYFPWEHKYSKIPQEVHDAFERECFPERFKPIEYKHNSQGLNEIMNQPITQTKLTQQDLIDFFYKMEELEQKRRKEMEEKEKRAKEIWDKHYKKYGLEYR
jgi:hypothetical protein